jgi:hypothetical protein
MIGSILEWNGINGRIMNVDEGDITYPFSSVDVVGEITVGDIVTFDNNGVGETSKAVSIEKKS